VGVKHLLLFLGKKGKLDFRGMERPSETGRAVWEVKEKSRGLGDTRSQKVPVTFQNSACLHLPYWHNSARRAQACLRGGLGEDDLDQVFRVHSN